MAKKQHDADTDAHAGTVAVHIPVGLMLEAHGFTLDASTASPAALGYCLRNGFRQSITDAAAFAAKDKEGKSDDEVAAMAHDARQKRFDAIVGGTVGERVGGPRKRGLDAIVDEIAEKYAIASLVKRGKPTPKRGKGYAEAVRGLIALAMANESFAARVRADAQTQFEAEQDAVAGLPDFEAA